MDRVHGTKCNLRMATQDDPVGPLQDGFVYGHHPEHAVCEITLQFLPGGATHSNVNRSFPLFPYKGRPRLRKSQLRDPNICLTDGLFCIEKTVRLADNQLYENRTIQIH